MLRNQKILVGPPEPVLPAHLSFSKFILSQFSNEDKNKPALVNGEDGNQITYGELLQKSVNVAVALHKKGMKKGDIVGFCSENRFEFMITALAVMFNGGVIANLNIMYSPDEMKHVLSISKPKYMICSSITLHLHKETFAKLKQIKSYILFDEVPKDMKAISYAELEKNNIDVKLFDPVEASGDDLAVINCSSGTTGLPKGVMITHLNLLYTATVMVNVERMEREGIDRLLTVIPWFHAYGFCSTLSYLSARLTIVYLQRFEQEQYLKTIQDYKVNVLLTVPPMLVLFAKSPSLDKYDLSSLRDIGCGAAPLSLEIVNELKRRMPNLRDVIQGYGLTECTMGVIRDNVVIEKTKDKSTGQLLFGVRAKVVDIETRELLGPNETGELCFKGPQLMKGYMGQAKTTAEAFDDEGFIKSGDVGYYDEEGFFYIVDRIKELIKYKGFQVPPAEVEAVILELPGVLECGVAGKPDQLAGELPTAFVVKRPGAQITEKEVIEHVASKLSKPKQLHGGVIFVNEIPKNPSGKILRRVLKEQLKKSPKSKI